MHGNNLSNELNNKGNIFLQPALYLREMVNLIDVKIFFHSYETMDCFSCKYNLGH